MNVLGSIRTRFVAILTEERPCPECETGALEPGYVRDPSTQDHWRGIEADVCDSCDYAERAESTPKAT